MSLTDLLETNAKAAAFYEALHPSIRQTVDANAADIILDQDLYAVANNAMTEGLRSYPGLYDDSDTWPD